MRPRTHLADGLTLDVPAALRALSCRVLFVAGAEDRVVPAASVAALHTDCASPEKDLVVLPGVEHDYRDHPEQLEQVSAAVLDRLC